MSNKLIPENKEGKRTDLDTSIETKTKELAEQVFDAARKRLLDPDNWHKLCGIASAAFKLVDATGKEVDRPAKEGDYLRINIPGPGPKSGQGYDWVSIELIEKNTGETNSERSIGMKLKAASNPNKEDKSTAHFFKGPATSSFLITNQGCSVTASYHGRNETINNDTQSVKDNIRNTAVALGAISGLSEIQWSRLIKAFLGKLTRI